MWLTVVCTLVTVSMTSGLERENGILYDHSSVGLRLWDPLEHVIRNNGYPNRTPHDLFQTWRIVAFDNPGQKIAIKVTCRGILVPKIPGRNDCGDYNMIMKDGGQVTKEFCGQYNGPFEFISKTNDLLFELRTGEQGGAILDCTVQAIAVAGDGTEITITTTPRPNRPTYLDIESEEVDSSEDGGEEGDKKTTCPCGWANKAKSRIVNGTVTASNEFPFMAALIYRGARGNMCGATIITRYHALTAAHCTTDPPEQLCLVVGIYNIRDKNSPEYNIEKYVNHAHYTREIARHDISLVTLERPIQFNQIIGPACLPHAFPRLQLDRQYVKAIGWGGISTLGPSSEYLRKVNLRVVPIEECNRRLGYVSVDNPTQICTYSKGKSPCYGDSGGPLVWLDPETNRYVLIGVTSFGIKCGEDFPAGFTSVQSYFDWIDYQIKISGKPDSPACTKID